MPTLYKRFTNEGRSWRNVYKSLVLIDFMIRHGPDRVVEYFKTHIYDIKACLNYQLIDEKGKDQGLNVRHRAKLIIEVLSDQNLISSERKKENSNASVRNYQQPSIYTTPEQEPKQLKEEPKKTAPLITDWPETKVQKSIPESPIQNLLDIEDEWDDFKGSSPQPKDPIWQNIAQLDALSKKE